MKAKRSDGWTTFLRFLWTFRNCITRNADINNRGMVAPFMVVTSDLLVPVERVLKSLPLFPNDPSGVIDIRHSLADFYFGETVGEVVGGRVSRTNNKDSLC